MTTPKSAPSTFRFQLAVKDALVLIADQQGRSMANMLEWLIKQHCESEGLGWLPHERQPTQGHERAVKAGRRSNARTA
jgi:hypothetical protein